VHAEVVLILNISVYMYYIHHSTRVSKSRPIFRTLNTKAVVSTKEEIILKMTCQVNVVVCALHCACSSCDYKAHSSRFELVC